MQNKDFIYLFKFVATSLVECVVVRIQFLSCSFPYFIRCNIIIVLICPSYWLFFSDLHICMKSLINRPIIQKNVHILTKCVIVYIGNRNCPGMLLEGMVPSYKNNIPIQIGNISNCVALFFKYQLFKMENVNVWILSGCCSIKTIVVVAFVITRACVFPQIDIIWTRTYLLSN